MIGGVGITEILLIVALLVLFFGAKKIPLIARGVGEGIRNFKTGMREPDRLEKGPDTRERDDEERG